MNAAEVGGTDAGATGPDDGPVRLPVADGARVRAVLRRELHGRRAAGLLGGLAMVVGAAVSLLAAPLLGQIVDLVVDGRGAEAVTGPVWALVAIAVGQGVLLFVGVALVTRVGETVLARLRERFVDRALHLPLSRIERAGSGDLTSRISDDVAVIAEAVRQTLPRFTQAALLVALSLVGLAALDWWFLLGAAVAVPVQVATARWFLRASSPVYAAQRIAYGDQQQQLLDTASGVATVRAFGLQDGHAAKVDAHATAVVRLAMRVVLLQTRFFGRLNGAEFLGVCGVLTAGFFLVGSGAATIGAATAAALYFINLFGPINIVLFQLDAAQSAVAALRRIVGVADLAPDPTPTSPARPADAAISMVDLQHSYLPGHPVLRGVDLELAAGSRVAVVGPSGAGKSTLVALVAGLHAPDRGRVAIGGTTAAERGPEVSRRTVALVTQEVHVFTGPIADDLRLAAPDATDDQLSDALAAVGATDWVAALPDGADTVVGDGGHELTVVQSQQLALARLLLADPPVVLLDEATAEAGSAGAAVLERAADAAVAGRTALVVAHRLSQAATADRVLVLDAGQVVQDGTHAELLASDGVYARLWASWSGQRTGEPAPPD